MKRQLAIWVAHLPHNSLSRLVGWFASIKRPRLFAKFYCFMAKKLLHINTEEAVIPPGGYASVNALFTRTLKEGARPIDAAADAIVSPVDGAFGQCGQLDGLMAVQAKGVTYPVNRLLGDDTLGERFRDGTFATLYLCPADYHHIHSPLDGEVLKAIHIPGGLLPVFKESTEVHTDLFVRNERLISLLNTASGLVAVVKIGATSVGKITLAYDSDLVTNRKNCREIIQKEYAAGTHPVKKGAELGVFNLGSTVVLLFEKGRATIDTKPVVTKIKYGQKVGTLVSAKDCHEP